MNAIKRHPLFTVWIVLCVVLVAGGLGWLHHLRKNSQHELASLAKKQQQAAQWREEIRAIPDIAKLPADQHDGNMAASHPEPVPRKPLDAFIAISAAQEEMRRSATSKAVAIAPDEAFGFATYKHEGPPEKDLGAVHEQLALTKLMVGKLFAAHPEKLLAIRREPLRAGEAGGRETPDDFFTPDSRQNGMIEGRAVQLEFTGQTPVLRAFLNSLANAPEPLVVRGVEVEPAREGTKQPGHHSKFSVIVQLARLGEGHVLAGEATSGWTVPNWRGDLFNPPDVERPSPQIVGIANGVGCELLAVKREPYRLQLAGYFGAPGDYTATFVSPGSPAALQARVGHRFESLGLTLKSFALKRREAERNSGVPDFELTACAEIWDERRQEAVILVGHELLLTDTPLAILRFGPSSTRPGEFRVGDAFRDGRGDCRIEDIRLDPAEVVILREQSGHMTPERIVLKPIALASSKLSSAYPSK